MITKALPFVVVALSIPALCLRAYAQVRPDTALSDPTIVQCRSFDKALSWAAAKAKVCLIAEDQPLQRTLSHDAAVNLHATLAAGKIVGSQTIPIIAAAFDYDAEVSADGITLLHKRFSKEEDLPDVYPGEIIRYLDNILTIGARYYPDYDRKLEYTAVKTVIAGLAPTASTFVTPLALPVSTLSKEEQSNVWYFANSVFLSSDLIAIRRVRTHLQGLDYPETRFLWKVWPQQLSVLCYEGVYADGARTFSLDPRYSTTIGGGTMWDHPPDSDLPEHNPLLVEPVAASQPNSLNRVTLSQLAAKGYIPVYDVDKAVATKHVTLFGAECASAEAILHAAARLYGLRVAKISTDSKHYLVTMPTAQAVQNPNELREAVARVTPPSLVHLLSGVSKPLIDARAKQDQEDWNKANPNRPIPTRLVEFHRRSTLEAARWAVPNMVGGVAKDRLRQMVLKQVPNAKAASVRIRDTGLEEHHLLTVLALCSSCLRSLDHLLTLRVPHHVADWEHAIIQIIPPDKKNRRMLSIGYLNDKGVFVPETSAGES